MHNGKLINTLRQRSSGILLPLFSLPSPYGCGDLGPQARRFIDFLQASGQSWWQILPLGPTSPVFGNSPYMCYSAFAGSPLCISPELLFDSGLLKKADLSPPRFSEYQVDYDKVFAWKQTLLAKAWKQQRRQPSPTGLDSFVRDNAWARDFGLFLALKNRFQQQPWHHWPDPLRYREEKALRQAASELEEQVEQHLFSQYLFHVQWEELRNYAGENGIRIIGDLPIYVAHDSVDVWVHQDLFDLDSATSEPLQVAGVPPDYFSTTGQRWGNPLYRWNTKEAAVKDRLWKWWEARLQRNFFLADTVRIDHFRGFASYWAIPADEETAVKGRWMKGPGKSFFQEMTKRLGHLDIIAEDLGHITPDVKTLRRTLGYPGMKILLFAFDGDPRNSYLPYNYDQESVVYTGTHDNDTAVGWFLSPEVDPASKQRAKRYANRDDDHAGTFHRELIHLALASPSRLAILPMQDVLGFGNDCRINTPGTTENNWRWRCASRFITADLASWLRSLTALFGRLPDQNHPRSDPA